MPKATSAWLTVAVVVAVAMIAGGWRLASTVIPIALDAESGLSELRGSPVSRLLAEDPELDALRREVTELKADIEPAGRYMRWVGRLSPAFAWFHMARQEMDAWASHMDRVEADLEVATALIDSSSRLLDLYSDAETALVEAGAASSVQDLEAQVKELEDSFALSLETVSDSRRAGRRFSAGLQAPRIRRLADLLGDLEDRMVTASDLGRRSPA